MERLPLKNTETKNIPIGTRIQQEIVKSTKIKTKPCHSIEPDSGGPGSAQCSFGNPTYNTTTKLLKLLHETKSEKPKLGQMLEDKLASPNTAKYLRRKKASKVNIPESKSLYEDLVSLDVSGTGLIRGVEEDLRRRACAVRPPPRSPDPEPSLTDYFKEEEFLSVRTVGPSNIFPRSSLKKPLTAEVSSLHRYTNILLGSD